MIPLVTVLVQNQGEMLKSGRLATPYKGIADCASRTYADEGLVACSSFFGPRRAPAHAADLELASSSLAWKHGQRHPLLPDPGPQLVRSVSLANPPGVR